MIFEELPVIDGLLLQDISTEQYREYDRPDGIYRIDNPIGLYIRKGGTTHRVVDWYGVSHCVAFPGENSNVILRWKTKDVCKPVNF